MMVDGDYKLLRWVKGYAKFARYLNRLRAYQRQMDGSQANSFG